MPKTKEAVFLNIPYDPQFTRLYLAYITALSAMSFLPRATLGITGNRRLDRIAPRTPRFNMPFELGLVVAWSKAHPQHKWFVFESVKRRLNKSLSDLDGTDPYIHGGKVRGVMREVCNAFVSPVKQPTVPRIMKMYRELRRDCPRILTNAGAQSMFTARVFSDLCLAAASLRSKYLGPD